MPKEGEFTTQIVNLMREYSLGIGEITEKILETEFKRSVETLKKNSPKSKKRHSKIGPYYKRWRLTKVNKVVEGKVYPSFIIHNLTYSLPHLLENKHKTRDGGFTKAIPHIKPVEDKLLLDVQKRLESEIKRGG